MYVVSVRSEALGALFCGLALLKIFLSYYHYLKPSISLSKNGRNLVAGSNVAGPSKKTAKPRTETNSVGQWWEEVRFPSVSQQVQLV